MRKPCLWPKNAEGATAIEYALIVAGLAIVIAAAVFSAGGSLAGAFIAIEQFLAALTVS